MTIFLLMTIVATAILRRGARDRTEARRASEAQQGNAECGIYMVHADWTDDNTKQIILTGCGMSVAPMGLIDFIPIYHRGSRPCLLSGAPNGALQLLAKKQNHWFCYHYKQRGLAIAC